MAMRGPKRAVIFKVIGNEHQRYWQWPSDHSPTPSKIKAQDTVWIADVSLCKLNIDTIVAR